MDGHASLSKCLGGTDFFLLQFNFGGWSFPFGGVASAQSWEAALAVVATEVISKDEACSPGLCALDTACTLCEPGLS